jgi:hypothetical protein|tara:strand:+ start:719 stop:1006 length:288 start_codon:yes stop_codon:yes gene_type:complete
VKKQKVIFYFIILLVFFILLFFVIFYYSNLTGKIVEDISPYTFTKAVCNNSNYCEDYEVTCEGNNLVSFTPTGAAIQLDKDWKDPRNDESIERLC